MEATKKLAVVVHIIVILLLLLLYVDTLMITTNFINPNPLKFKSNLIGRCDMLII